MAFLVITSLCFVIALVFLPDRFHAFVLTTLISSFVIAALPAPMRKYVKKIGTYTHEVAHGVASWVSGGQFHGFVVRRAKGSLGLATTSGGVRPLVIGAGYVFTPVVGAILLTVSAQGGGVDEVLLALAIMTALITMKARTLSTAFLGLVIAGTMAAPAVAAPESMVGIFILNFFAVILLWDGLGGLRKLLSMSMSRRGENSDAESMAREVGGPVILWAFVFALIAFALLLAIVLYGFSG